jgi:hypothetical protein
MISRSTIYWVIGGLLAATTACASLQSRELIPGLTPSPSPSNSPTTVIPSDVPSDVPDKVQADTKIITMNLEGEPREVELKLFHHQDLPFTTYYPAQVFTPEVQTSAEGVTVRFYFSPTGVKDEDAYLAFFLPHRSTNLDTMQDLILGDRGLLVTNQWELLDRTDIVSYGWAEEKLLYQHQTGAEQAVGAIYMGEEDGNMFYTLTHYPVEYGDGFEPRSNIIWENLQF